MSGFYSALSYCSDTLIKFDIIIIIIIIIIFFLLQIVRQIARHVKVVLALYVSMDMRFTKALDDSVKVAAFVNVQKVIKQG